MTVQTALDNYQTDDTVPALTIHQETQKRHGSYYQSPGYYLKLYRKRKDMTQSVLADAMTIKQHHISEMKYNKRPIGKKLARELAKLLDVDCRKFL